MTRRLKFNKIGMYSLKALNKRSKHKLTLKRMGSEAVSPCGKCAEGSLGAYVLKISRCIRKHALSA